MRYINLTPHDIHLYAEDKKTLLETFPASGEDVRCIEENEHITEDFYGVPIIFCKMLEPENMPEPKPNTTYIVSPYVLDNLTGRRDVLAPHTGPDHVVRDADGQIAGTIAWKTSLK